MKVNVGRMIFRLSIVLFSIGLTACSTISYYTHLLDGQVSLLWNREPVDELLLSPDTPEKLRDRLLLSQEIRAFANDTLKLPVGDVYTSYTDLSRPYVVWNIYAAPELSLESYTWCYPILGCLAYRGYYEEAWAKKDAATLVEQGLETRVGGVRAYSTLGFFDDPLLNTFILSEEAYFVELLIHEITHRKLYIKDDTKFNENFATAVGTLGAELWYRQQNQEDKFQTYQLWKAGRKKLTDFVLIYKDMLQSVYQNDDLNDDQKRERKAAVMSELKAAYQTLKQANGWDGRYDNWINNLNNAVLSTMSNYQDLVPAFIALYRKTEDWELFYEQVEKLSELKKSERHKRLKSLVAKEGE